MSGLSTSFGQAGIELGYPCSLGLSSSSRSELSRHQTALQCVGLVNNKHSVITLSCCVWGGPLSLSLHPEGQGEPLHLLLQLWSVCGAGSAQSGVPRSQS